MSYFERRITRGPVQKDGSILIAVYDPEEVHDILINPEGILRSENIWGGYLHLSGCDACGGYFESISRYDYQCSDCGKRFYNTHHCLVYDHKNNEIYQGNRGITHFVWRINDES